MKRILTRVRGEPSRGISPKRHITRAESAPSNRIRESNLPYCGVADRGCDDPIPFFWGSLEGRRPSSSGTRPRPLGRAIPQGHPYASTWPSCPMASFPRTCRTSVKPASSCPLSVLSPRSRWCGCSPRNRIALLRSPRGATRALRAPYSGRPRTSQPGGRTLFSCSAKFIFGVEYASFEPEKRNFGHLLTPSREKHTKNCAHGSN